jgi:hypothetical protein
MHIQIKQFGTTLISRPAGKEAFLALQPQLTNLAKNEKIDLDFKEVNVLTPSWADEFITPLQEKYKSHITLSNTKNPSIKVSNIFESSSLSISFKNESLSSLSASFGE